MKTRIRLIRANPPARYCTKRVPCRLRIPYWDWDSTVPSYIAAFNSLNNLKD